MEQENGSLNDIINQIIYCAQEQLDPYCDDMIKRYVMEVIGGARTQDGEQGHLWMREDLLTSSLYSCKLSSGEEIPLNEMLFGRISANTRQNIIVIMGKEHIGKRCFVEKLLDVCKATVDLDGRSRGLPKQNKQYRLPVIIDHDLHRNTNSTFDLVELITSTVENKFPSMTNASGHKRLKWKIKQLLAEGRFIIYFKGTCWLRDLEDELRTILSGGDIIDFYSKKATYHNLVILTVNSESDVKESFLNENNFVSIQLKKLTKNEVKKYLEKYIPSLLGIIEEEGNALEILRYPENLRMFEALYHKKLLEGEQKSVIKDRFGFYDYYIRANIREQLKAIEHSKKSKKPPADSKRSSEINNPQRVDAIFLKLQKYAACLYLKRDIVKEQPSTYFRFHNFIKCGILNEEEQFTFPMCGYYLVARQLVLELEQNTLQEIPICLLEEPLEIILLWVSRMINSVETFFSLWQLLLKSESYRLLLLAKIVRGSQFKDSYIDEIYKMAFLNLKEDFYDYTVLEVFNEMGYDSGNYLKSKYLDLGNYDEIPRNNIKKRSVYYLGISHKGIISTMLDELINENTDLHLKYHIIRAMVENYGNDENSTKLIHDNFGRLTEYCSSSSDPIIRSDFCVLFKKHTGKDLMAPDGSYNLLKLLKDRLEDTKYWVRAHAAGTIGRRSGDNEKNESLLLDRIKKELHKIYEEDGDYRNSIKVISYSVEAICEISDLDIETKETIICELVKLIDINRLGNRDVEDAYSTIATGIEFLINADTKKPPFNLGGRFRNHIINYQKVLLNIFRELEFFFYDEDQEMVGLVREKQEEMERIIAQKKAAEQDEITEESNEIRILQLSDWHFKGESAQNNLIIAAVKREVKKINILVITGDLKQYDSNYDETLEVLRQLTKSLGLSPRDVFIVPGNHDCGYYADKEKIVKEVHDNIDKNPEYYQKHLDQLMQGFQEYEAFLKNFYGSDSTEQGGIENRLLLWDNRLHILTMNTALLCDGDTDKKKLVNILELSKIEKESDDNLPTICISHHPMSLLYFDHESTVKQVFKNLNVSALLSGDLHRSKLELIHVSPKEIPNYCCGEFVGESGDYWPSHDIAIYTLDLKERTLMPQLYAWRDNQFVPDQTFCERPETFESAWNPKKVELL